MLLGLGIDLCSQARVERLYKKHPERFLTRICHEAEQEYIRQSSNPPKLLAKRFAAKEAIVKALGTGFRNGISWQDILIRHSKNGMPKVELYGQARLRAQQLEPQAKIKLSLTSERTIQGDTLMLAMALVVIA